ncbi:hypothetical protein FIV42_03510 [Persicimonas caeni]|uniref:Uncharacterized protein n=1 Tax=Persicimonas caeni TaxID=2292766 RepID=A0A4Y6PNE9_PERCE|nr:hypothetical protein [Persicimonas caeni]QDG49838.1 hypothetical protein FIV42_03510 [Persicimonas caeni]QED31059.1 hypothetical protein FRD00_03505 [Persicimonas caeni]
MDEQSENEPRARGDGNSESIYDTLEADVLEESKKAANKGGEDDEVLLSDVAVTAEFDYIDLDDESEASEASNEPEAPAGADAPMAGITKKKANNNKASTKSNSMTDSHGGPITRALDDFDSFLDGADDQDDLASPASPTSGPELVSSDPNLSSGGGGAWGFDQPQVSGVFSRYEEETGESDSDEFDLFDEEEGEEPRERTLQEIVSAHEKQLRRLERRVAYQKEVIQVVSELLVEARVISKRELKKRLRALRDKS